MATTTERNTTIVGLFDTVEHAQKAVQELVQTGIDRSDISLVARDQKGGVRNSAATDPDDGTASADGTSIGENVAGGTLYGGLGGLLIGLGALLIPGIGPVIAAGPIATTLAGAGIGALGGGVIGWMKESGISDEDAHVYAESVRRGGTLVTIHSDGEHLAAVSRILDANGAVDVDERAENYKQGGWNQFDQDAAPYTPAPAATSLRETGNTVGTVNTAPAAPVMNRRETSNVQGEQTLPVVEEELQVGKREVQRGGVRVYQKTTERPVQESVNLREEHVHVERRPVDRPISSAEMGNFKESSIELTETAEEAVVGKRARVVEEVVVGKDVEQRTETIRDTVRRTDVEVEQLGSNVSGDDYRQHFQTTYGTSGKNYETYAPAYQYGNKMASDPRYQGKSYSAVETDLRRDYETNYPGSTWENIKGAVQHGWDKVTGKY